MADFREPHLPLYIDERLAGEDSRPLFGLEASTLAFYAGHGDTNFWTVPDYPINKVPVIDVHVGDGDLRYFWLYSCRVMAHGPERAGDYSAPHLFVAKCKDANRSDADVFERWHNSLGSGIRMVCGGSTYLGYTHVGEIWNYLLESQTSVADAFVLGLAHEKQVPVCLARGGQAPRSSALADRKLHRGRVKHSGPAWLHLQYPVRCRVEHNAATFHVRCGEPLDYQEVTPGGAQTEAPNAIVTSVPVVNTAALPSPAVSGYEAVGRLPLGFIPLGGSSKRMKFHPASGAVVLTKSRDRYSRLDRCDAETSWAFQPSALLKQSGLDLEVLRTVLQGTAAGESPADSPITALEMRVESRPDGKMDRVCAVRSLFLLLHSEVEAGTNPYPIFGPAILLEIQRGDGGRPVLASFSAPRRSLAVSTQKVEVKSESDVVAQAYKDLQLKPTEYPINAVRAVLGYEEAPLRCGQEFLRPTYEIQFFPAAGVTDDRPTVIVRRDARRDTSEANGKCEGWGDEEDVPEP